MLREPIAHETPEEPQRPNDANVARRPGRLRRYFLMEEELAEARAASFGPHEPGFREYERARGAEEAVAAIMAPRELPRWSDGTGPAMTLAREAVHWAAAAHLARAGRNVGEARRREVVDAFLTLPAAASTERLMGSDAFRAAIELARVEGQSTTEAGSLEELAALRGLAFHLLSTLDADTAATRLKIRRGMRIGGAVALVSALTTASVLGVSLWLRGPNLALHRPTSASSAYRDQVATSGVVDGIKTVHGFHTDEEDKPWLRIDLGSTTKVGSVVVYNRSDCCEDRAAPLVVEVSTDGENWTQVARREKTFSIWRARFSAVDARWVRLTAQKKTWLHFNEVEVYRGG